MQKICVFAIALRILDTLSIPQQMDKGQQTLLTWRLQVCYLPQGPHVPVVELIVIGGTSQVGWLRANLLPSNADFTKPALNARPWHAGLAEVICVGWRSVGERGTDRTCKVQE